MMTDDWRWENGERTRRAISGRGVYKASGRFGEMYIIWVSGC
jgi:hypothetical protein